MGFNNVEDMKAEKEEIVNFFNTQYKHMLEENFDNYVKVFANSTTAAKASQDKTKDKVLFLKLSKKVSL